MAAKMAEQILIAGGGMVGMTTAYRLERKLRREIARGEVKLTLVDPQSYMTYQSFLPEAAAGSLEPRHVVVPLRRVLRRTDVITGAVTAIDQGDRRVRVAPHGGEPYDLYYDRLVVALGSVTRTLPIPGLAETGIGFKTVQEAIWLRNHVLERLDAADAIGDVEVRQRALSFVFVGGGYSGIEALAELEDMAQDVVKKYYPKLNPSEMRWVLVEATGRILPEVGPELGEYTVGQLRDRGIEVKLNTTLDSVTGGHVMLSDGTEFDADTVVWTAGVKPNPVLADSDLTTDQRGRVRGRADLQAVDAPGVWVAGDNAAIPDLTSDDPDTTTTAPNAQHAVRQAKVLAANILRARKGRQPKPYRHKYLGSVASLGMYKGVAQVYGIKLRGPLAWFMHRTYHVGKMPTFNRKVRIVLDWTLATFFRREVVSLGAFARPREEFERSAIPRQPPAEAESAEIRVPDPAAH